MPVQLFGFGDWSSILQPKGGRHDRRGHGFKRRRRVVESRPTGRPPRSFPLVKTDSPAPLSVDYLNSFYDTNKNYANVLVLFIDRTQEHLSSQKKYSTLPSRCKPATKPPFNPFNRFYRRPQHLSCQILKQKTFSCWSKRIIHGCHNYGCHNFLNKNCMHIFPAHERVAVSVPFSKKNQSFSRIEQSHKLLIVNCLLTCIVAQKYYTHTSLWAL